MNRTCRNINLNWHKNEVSDDNPNWIRVNSASY